VSKLKLRFKKAATFLGVPMPNLGHFCPAIPGVPPDMSCPICFPREPRGRKGFRGYRGAEKAP